MHWSPSAYVCGQSPALAKADFRRICSSRPGKAFWPSIETAKTRSRSGLLSRPTHQPTLREPSAVLDQVPVLPLITDEPRVSSTMILLTVTTLAAFTGNWLL